jgi:hypothetical protein
MPKSNSEFKKKSEILIDQNRIQIYSLKNEIISDLEEPLKKHLKLYATAFLLISASADGYVNNQLNYPPETTEKPRSNADVFLSHPCHTFEMFGSALLLQPTGSHLHYAAEAVPLPAPSPNWKIHQIDTDYHFGFDVGVRGIFHSTNSDLTLNWEHFHSTDSASKRVSSTNMIGPFFEIGPDASPYKKARGKAIFHFDEVNLDYGILINFGDRLKTTLYSGVSFAYIHQTLFSKFSNFGGTIVRTIKVPSTFHGAGPQLGLDFAYRIVKGFHFVGEAAASLLVGRQKNHTTFKADSPALAPLGITPPNKQKTNVHKKTQVVPGLEGKLGLSYVFTYCEHFMIKLEAGYQAQIYINAIQSIDMGSEVVTPPVVPDTVGVFARTFEQTLSNFALAGPYFTLDVGF